MQAVGQKRALDTAPIDAASSSADAREIAEAKSDSQQRMKERKVVGLLGAASSSTAGSGSAFVANKKVAGSFNSRIHLKENLPSQYGGLPTTTWCFIMQFLKIQEKIGGVNQLSRFFCNLIWDSKSWVSVDCVHLKHVLHDQLFFNISRSWSQLRRLGLMECYDLSDEAIVQLAAACPLIQTLDLTGCNMVSNKGMQALSEKSGELTDLNLCSCLKVDDVGLQALANGCHKMRRLNLWGLSTISNQAVQHISQGMPLLEDLDLTWCRKITDDAFCHFDKVPNLRRLTVMWCERLRDDFIRHLKNQQQVTYINMDGCGRVSDIGISLLTAFCPNMEHVSIRFLSKITSAATAVAIESLPKLRKFNCKNCDCLDGDEMLNLMTKKVTALVLV